MINFWTTPVLCSFIYIAFTIPSIAQVSQPNRYEKEHKGSDEIFSIIPLKTEGLALLREKNKYDNGKQLWEFIQLDTILKEKKNIELKIENRHHLVGYEYTFGHLYLLYRTGETTRNSVELIDISLQTDEVGHHEIKPELDFKLTHFSKVGPNIVLGGYVNNEPAILLYEISTNHIKVLPGFFQKDTELVDLRVNQNQTFNVMLIDRSSKDDRKLIFKTFDEDGKLLLEDVVGIERNKTLQTGMTSTLEREDLVIAGTFGERNSKQSQGFYILSIDPFRDQKITYVYFGQLSHYLDYLKPKRAQHIKEKTAKDLVEGRNPDFINYVMPYKILEHEGGFLLLAECYSPTSTVQNSNFSNPYGYSSYYNPYFYNPYYSGYNPGRFYRPYSYGNNVRNADEVETNESILLSFDSSGKINWDHSIKLDEIKLPSLEQVSDFSYTNSKITFFYKKKTELKTKTILLSDEEMSETIEKIITNDPLDEIRSEKEDEGGFRQWYDNTFYIWGYQTIRNNLKEDRVRDVFYINKVVAK